MFIYGTHHGKNNKKMEFIQGQKLFDIADYLYILNINGLDEYYNLPNTLNINLLKDGDIIYTHTQFIPYLFDLIKDINISIKLISHNSDHSVNNIIIPNCVKEWYSMNVNYIHDKIISIPIGLENDMWYKNIDKCNKIKNMNNNNKNHKNLVYMNHNINTNRKERMKPYELFRNKPWCSYDNGSNGQNFNNYLDNVYNHKFVICPEGNGIDTHRTWETLYINSIPIEKRNINNQFYTDLPICFVDDWEEITEDFLNTEYDRIINTEWNLERMDFNYWVNKIKK